LYQPNVCPGVAMYGVDVILELNDAEILPKVLEVQWAPDCDRAVQLNPYFWDEILSSLFLADDTEMISL